MRYAPDYDERRHSLEVPITRVQIADAKDMAATVGFFD